MNFLLQTESRKEPRLIVDYIRLTDNFFRFLYTFVFTNYSELEDSDVDGVYEYAMVPNLYEFAATMFEDVCREYQKANALPFRYARMGRWWGKTTVRRKTEIQDTEIDILAVSRQSEKYLVGECKFKTKPFRYSKYLDTVIKLSIQKEKSEFYYYLFPNLDLVIRLWKKQKRQRI